MSVLYIDPFLNTYYEDTKEHVEKICQEVHQSLKLKDNLKFSVAKSSQPGCKYPDLKNIKAIISLGSYAHVDEKREWFKPLKQYLLKALEKGIPVLGICFTHQLMGVHYGLKIGKLRDKAGHLRRHGWSHQRDMLITHPKFRFLLWKQTEENFSLLQECIYLTCNWSLEKWEAIFSMEDLRLSGQERRVKQAVEKHCPVTMKTFARHFEELYEDLHQSEILTVGTSPYCSVDALMHKTLPLVTLQPHPERPVHTDGSTLIRNFITQALL